MTTPEYVVTRAGQNGLLDFSTEGKLHKLEVGKDNRIFYGPIATGKLSELAKLAEELNTANEPMAETAKIEPDDAPTVGEPTLYAPTDPSIRHGWTLNRLQSAISAVDAGRMNLVEFKRTIQNIYTALEEL